MAYVPKQIPEDQENLFARTEPTTPVPQGGGSAGEGGNAAPGVGSSTQFGSNAAKLTDYLNANQEQVQQFGQDIAGDLTNKYNQTMGDIDTGYGQFNQQVGANYTPPDQTRLDQAFQNPADFMKNQQNATDFQNWYNPQYGGPQNFEGSSIYSNLNNSVNKAVENAGLTGNISGIGTYINNFMGANDTTQGMRTLDAALLQRNPGARTAIQQAADPFKNLGAYLGDTTQKANTDIANVKEQVSKSGEDVRKKTGDVASQFSEDLNARLAQQKQTAQMNDAAFKQAVLNNGQLSDAEKQLYGVNNWDDIMGARKNLGMTDPFREQSVNYGRTIDFNPYITQGNYDTAFSQANVANADDYAREAALQQMTQNQFNILPDDITQAGTAPKNLAQFNQQGATQDTVNLLKSLDEQFLQNDFTTDLNQGKTQSDFVGWLQQTDPTSGGQLRVPGYQRAVDIAKRNEASLTPQQKSLMDYLQQSIGLAQPGAGGGPDDGSGSTDQTEGRLRVVDGQFKWYDGNGWVDAPPEYRGSGDSRERFDYNTGQYVPAGSDDGIFRASSTPGVY